jgi:hypothetical protein
MIDEKQWYQGVPGLENFNKQPEPPPKIGPVSSVVKEKGWTGWYTEVVNHAVADALKGNDVYWDVYANDKNRRRRETEDQFLQRFFLMVKQDNPELYAVCQFTHVFTSVATDVSQSKKSREGKTFVEAFKELEAFYATSPYADLLAKAVAYWKDRNDVYQAELRPAEDILAPSGGGKTTLIEQLILADLSKPDPPAIIVIDPKGFMVERISKLALFVPGEPLYERLVIIDANDPLPALNLFQQPDKGTENQVISNFAYIFSQAKSPLTAKMAPVFGFAVRLMFAVPNANIFTLMDLFDDSPKERKFQRYIDRLSDEGARRFFANDFYASNYVETRQQIKARLYEIISRPEIIRMFNAPVCKLDMFDAIQKRKIVLVNTGRLKLG